MAVEVVVFGSENPVKTKMCQLLSKSVGTLQSNINLFSSEEWEIWKIKSIFAVRGKETPRILSKAKIALFCVDLSVDFDIQAIKIEIDKFREYNEKASLILVGTKQNQSINEQHLTEIFSGIPSEYSEKIAAYIPFSTQNEKEDKDSLVKLEEQMRALGPGPSYPLQKTRDKLIPESPLYKALDQFISAAKELNLSKEKFEQLALETDILFSCLDYKVDKEEAINDYSEKCKKILNDEPITLKNVFAGMVTALFTTLLVFSIGFAIGYACGVWTGPFALLTGIATGSTAAISLLLISGSCGTTAGALTCFGFFKEASIGSAEINQVAEAAKQPIELMG